MPQAHLPESALGKLGLEPQDIVPSTVEGPAIDRTQFRACKLTGMTGLATGGPSAQSATFKLEQSADGVGGWTDFGDALTAITADSSEQAQNFDLLGADKFIRVSCTVALTGGTSLLVAAALDLMGPQVGPTADPSST